MILRGLNLVVFIYIAFASFGQKDRYVTFKNIENARFGVESITQQVWDDQGRFWARTPEGLVLHDGYFKKEFFPNQNGENTIVSDQIVGINKVDTNEIWISYLDTNILTKINPKIISFEHFAVKELVEGLPEPAIVVRVKKDISGQLWLCTWGNGLIKFYENDASNVVYRFGKSDDVKKPEDDATGGFVKDIVELPEGRFLITFFHGGGQEYSYPGIFNGVNDNLEYLDIDHLVRKHSDFVQLQIKVASRIVHFVHQDKNGNFWFGTYSGLLFLNSKEQTLERISEAGEDLNLQNQVNTLSCVESGNQVWVGTLNRGMMVVDINTREVNVHYNDPLNSNSLSSNKIHGLSKDPIGNVWIASGTDVMSVYVPFTHKFKIMYWKDMEIEYSNRSTQNIPVNQLYVRNSQEVYVSSKKGLLVYDSRTMNLSDKFQFGSVFNENNIKNFGRHRGIENFKFLNDKIFMSFDSYPTMFDPQTEKLFIDKKSYGNFKIAFRHDNSVKEIILFRSGRQKTEIFTADEFTNTTHMMTLENNIQLIETFSFVTSNNKWIISEANGRFVLINPVDTSFHLFSPSQSASFFPDSTVTSVLIQDSEEILIGTKSALYSFNENTFEYENISSAVGLRENDMVNSMVIDNNGKIWIALKTELLCWDPVSKISQRFTENLGVRCSNFLPAIAQKDELGNLYFASMYGVLIFNPDDIIFPNDDLKLNLNMVKVNDDRMNDDAMTELMAGNRAFHWNENFIEFYFNTNQVFELSPHKFSYKLEGLNEKWISVGNTNHVRFDNLQHGEYELQFRATNAYGVDSSIFRIPFKIQKPYWLTWWFLLCIGFGVVFLVLILLKSRMKALRKRGELLENKVVERTAEVVEQKQEAERQKAEAEHQKEIVEEKQREITDSITYAKRIQDAILPSKELIGKYLPNSFVFYRPKDIVAGDFYWLEPISETEILIAAADCTGHGVPGAMVSVVCNNALNRTVREFKLSDPGRLLDSTRDLIIDQFERTSLDVQTSRDTTIKDGMDISLAKLDKKTNKLSWAGANNPLWIVRKGELIEIKGNKQPVGKFDPSENFTTHELQLEKGDHVYLFSDGYADQFGGDKGKKFKSSSLKALILSIESKDIKEQEALLAKQFDDWKGDYEQLDDVCVIGVKI